MQNQQQTVTNLLNKLQSVRSWKEAFAIGSLLYKKTDGDADSEILFAFQKAFERGLNVLSAKEEFGQLFAVHRLDKDTSGIVIYARTEEAHRSLCMQFEKREVHKVYHCLVNGHPVWQTLHVDLKLMPDGDARHRTVVNKRSGKISITDFTNLGSCGPYTWIKAEPKTGRTHQIRAHLQANGLGIVCDPLYSGNQKPVKLSDIKRRYNGDTFEERPLLSRLALHAYQLTVTHPVTNESITFTAPYSKDMEAVRNQLAKIFKVDPLA